MTTENTAAPPPAPAANPSAPTPPAPPAAPAAAPAAPAAGAAPIGITSDQLKARLDEERAKTAERVRAEILKEIGVEKLDDAKSKIADAKKLSDEKLGDIERRDKQIAELTPKAARAAELETEFATLVEEQLRSLPEAVQKAIEASAGTSVQERMKLIRVARALQPAAPTAAVAPAGAPAAATPAAAPAAPPAPLAPGATTAPAAGGPSAPPVPTSNHLATYEQLQKTRPFEAARYYEQHKKIINEARSARGAS